MTGIWRVATAVILVLLTCSAVAQVAAADQPSIILGRVTVDGHPQENVVVTGFGSTAITGPDGMYVLKFQSAGAGVINATYDNHTASSGLIVTPTSPVIRVKDLNIIINGIGAGAMTDSSSAAHSLYTKVLAPTGNIDDLKPAGQQHQPFDISRSGIYIAGAISILFICFLAYVMIRK
ncbi:hypothetical protein [Methanocella arvoryzae]|uniref:Carboxypeptidase regulatory-like domain-containing protein n=1 Tax=Methanocella arvoryzae (strain DSM 22066 / NBRC 105507 / MRE50) TaxID=351160 RepID=Q0W4R5_METAR|nr:hypothetical protein [Methanocella arvoryzae]CAJ36628.1 hypothetical protein RCIX1341 [Methanocella arvoryzae MRE50]